MRVEDERIMGVKQGNKIFIRRITRTQDIGDYPKLTRCDVIKYCLDHNLQLRPSTLALLEKCPFLIPAFIICAKRGGVGVI